MHCIIYVFKLIQPRKKTVAQLTLLCEVQYNTGCCTINHYINIRLHNVISAMY